jgi:Zn-finger in ubiquitin-hydrolases and other protein
MIMLLRSNAGTAIIRRGKRYLEPAQIPRYILVSFDCQDFIDLALDQSACGWNHAFHVVRASIRGESMGRRNPSLRTYLDTRATHHRSNPFIRHVASPSPILSSKAHNTISTGLAHCQKCELKENLWLCLTCGSLGCGRQQFGGVGGNGHGLMHYEETKHPISVKLGTITPEGNAGAFFVLQRHIFLLVDH